jgi:ABC-type iron transport system FetAB ATPase subunit
MLCNAPCDVPEVIRLNEPTSALDDATERGIEELALSILHERQLILRRGVSAQQVP